MNAHPNTLLIILTIAASLLLSPDVLAKPEACRNVDATCTKAEKNIDGAPFICTTCKQALCEGGGDTIVGNKTETSCVSKPTGLTLVPDDGSTFDSTNEMAPETDTVGDGDAGSIVAPNNITSKLVIVPTDECNSGSVKLCASNGASCGLVHDRSGEASEVCRWPSRNDVAACKNTIGIWTAANSRYARNHPDAVLSGSAGACITDVNNIPKKPVISIGIPVSKANEKKTSSKRTDHRRSGLVAPSNLSANDVSSTVLTLSWTDNSDNEFGVELYRIDPVAARRNQGSADWEFIGLFEERVDSNVKGTGPRSDEDYDLSPDTNYCYRLRAYTGFDRSSVSGFSETVCTKTES